MTVAALSNALKGILTRAGIENPAGDSELILEQVLECSRALLIARRQDEVSEDQAGYCLDMAQARASGEPIQYVLGVWPFMGREYAVGEGVLIPRDDTEVVVRAALEQMKGAESPCILDLCAGSGVIAVTLDRELPGAEVTAVEKSRAAFRYLVYNTRHNRTQVIVICADLRDCTDRFADRSLDLIVSNPPYIKSGELADLQPEVQYEPTLALDGGEDGLYFYNSILTLWTRKLKSGGVIAFELGEKQYEAVAEMLRERGYTDIQGYEDIQGTVRAVTAKRRSFRGKDS